MSVGDLTVQKDHLSHQFEIESIQAMRLHSRQQNPNCCRLFQSSFQSKFSNTIKYEFETKSICIIPSMITAEIVFSLYEVN